MVKSYWDESGIQDQDVALIAGYFGGLNQWKTFDRRWKAILDREGIEEFHAKKFWAINKNGERVGEYAGWSAERAKKFLDDLVDVAIGVDISPVGCGVVMDSWNRLTTDERRWLTGARWFKRSQKIKETGVPSQPYFFCFQWCIYDAVKYCKPGLKMDSVFDLNHRFEAYSNILWGILREEAIIFRHRLGNATFSSSSDAPGLQLADLFAYRSKRYAAKKLTDPCAKPGELLERLLVRMVKDEDFHLISDFSQHLKKIPPYLDSPSRGTLRKDDRS